MPIPKPIRALHTLVGALLLTVPLLCVAPSVRAQDKPAPPKEAKPPAEDPEIKLGREAHEELLKSGIRLIKDEKIVNRVKTIGDKIAAIANETQLKAYYGSDEMVPYNYQFFVVDDPDINAFSLPGGFIYINKGLLDFCQSDDELAGVLGHEIIHAKHHHVVKLQREQNNWNNKLLAGALIGLLARAPTVDMLNAMQGLQLLAIQQVNGFGRNAERDADRNGLIVAQKAGYNPVGMLTFMERLQREQQLRPDVELGIFRTHPPEKERATNAIALLKELGVPINRRAVTDILKVEVRPVKVAENVEATEVLLDKQIVYRTPNAARAKEVADRLNQALDKVAQIFDITRKGASILVRGETLFTITPEDAALPGSPAVDVLADTSFKNLRFAIYRQTIENGY
ncbi:MAG: hypothetical protein OHK0029_07150 [Armatimonadaceae bacterium]